MPLRVVLIGCVNSTDVALNALIDMPDDVNIVGALTRSSSRYNSDYVDLTPKLKSRKIDFLLVDEGIDEVFQSEWVRARHPDVIFCIGWSRLLGSPLLDSAKYGVIGFHPAALPENRGRHPIVWALVLGLKDTASTFFLMDAGTDSGPIVSQVKLEISSEEDAGSLYQKILTVIPMQIREIVTGLALGSLRPIPQDESRANYWRKRSKSDGAIDWRMDAASIDSLVRALASPYPGAHFLYKDVEVKVWRSELYNCCLPNIEPGKVIAINQKVLTVKCGKGCIKLIDHGMKVLPNIGEYL